MTDLPRSLAERLIRTAREGAPAEVCGVIGLQGGRIVRLDPVRNAASTPGCASLSTTMATGG